VVLKPASLTPLLGERIARVFERAGVPEGLVRVVHGPGTGPAVVSSGVGKVFFTGSVEAGRSVGEGCARRLKGSVLELGGKDPMLVLADANIDHAIAGALRGGFAKAGQTCSGIERVYVLREVADRLLRGAVSGVAHEMRIMREGIFGPVLPIVVVESEDEAITLANDSEFGLGASVWTSDRSRGERIAREVEAGMVWINDHMFSHGACQCSWG